MPPAPSLLAPCGEGSAPPTYVTGFVTDTSHRVGRMAKLYDPGDNEPMARRYWLMKCEPDAYSIGDLERDGQTCWEGVRNYQARNFMRDEMQVGHRVLFYASNADPSGVTGLAEVVRTWYPDEYAWKKGHKYFDARSTKDAPVWVMVDVGFVERFSDTVSLATLKTTAALGEMMVVKKGVRLSVQPVTKQEYDIVARLGRP